MTDSNLRNLPRFILGPWAKNTPLIEEDLERLERRREWTRAGRARWLAKPGNLERERERHRAWRAKPGNRERHRERNRVSSARWRAKPENRAAHIEQVSAHQKAQYEANWLALGWGPYCSICGSQNASGRNLDTAHVRGNEGKATNLSPLLKRPMSDELRREAAEVVPLCARCHFAYDRSWATFNPQDWPSLDRFAEVVREVQRENPSMSRAQLSTPLARRIQEMKTNV